MGEHTTETLRTARGDSTGVVMPACPASFRAMGAAFLTEAFRAYGVLPATAKVADMLDCEEVDRGNSGQKLRFDVRYEGAPSGLPTRLFAKFSRDFTDPHCDRRRDELESEIRLAALSRAPGFPIAVATPLFGDFEGATGTGLLITERIAFGQGAIEPLWRKCMDHQLSQPLEHYRTLVAAQARLCAAHLSGRLSPQMEALFPFDRTAAEAELPAAYDEAALRAKVAAWSQFIAAHPQLFPAALRSADWHERFAYEAVRLHAEQDTVRRFLLADPRFVALTHWNTNIDNARFWRDPEGTLHCGLLDWGMVRIMNVAMGLWGGISAGTTEFVCAESEGLLAFYVEELAHNGGPVITADELGLRFDLAIAVIALSMIMNLPATVAVRMPQIGTAKGPLDPLMAGDKVVQGFLLVSTNILAMWEQRGFGRSLARMLAG